jgi:glycosyltransferase involved in cell wall biosynthesis
MRILYVVTAAGFGGAPSHVLQLMEHMVKRGHAVGLCSAPEPRLTQTAGRLGVPVFPNPHFVRPVSLRHDVVALAPVVRALRSFVPDLVHAHSTKAGFATRLCAAILGFKAVVFTSHGWAFNEAETEWKRRAYEFAERYAAKVTTKIICVSEYHRSLALRCNVGRPDQLVVIPNGIDPGLFPGAKGDEIRKEFSLNGHAVIVVVSRLAPPKDFTTLLKAATLLPDKCKLLIVGDGELRQKTEGLIKDLGLGSKVTLTGNRTDIPDFLSASDVFALSSLSEGLPITIIEAMMSALPVVATNVGGVPELVDEGAGILVPPGAPEMLAKAITSLVADPDMRKAMGQSGRQRALEHFTLDRMLTATEMLYEDLSSLPRLKR